MLLFLNNEHQVAEAFVLIQSIYQQLSSRARQAATLAKLSLFSTDLRQNDQIASA
jgi:hypothetical protein